MPPEKEPKYIIEARETLKDNAYLRRYLGNAENRENGVTTIPKRVIELRDRILRLGFDPENTPIPIRIDDWLFQKAWARELQETSPGNTFVLDPGMSFLKDLDRAPRALVGLENRLKTALKDRFKGQPRVFTVETKLFNNPRALEELIGHFRNVLLSVAYASGRTENTSFSLRARGHKPKMVSIAREPRTRG